MEHPAHLLCCAHETMGEYRQLYCVQLRPDLLTSAPTHLYLHISIFGNGGDTVRLHQDGAEERHLDRAHTHTYTHVHTHTHVHTCTHTRTHTCTHTHTCTYTHTHTHTHARTHAHSHTHTHTHTPVLVDDDGRSCYLMTTPQSVQQVDVRLPPSILKPTLGHLTGGRFTVTMVTTATVVYSLSPCVGDGPRGVGVWGGGSRPVQCPSLVRHPPVWVGREW